MSILLKSLTKRYAGHPVVNQVSLEVKDGEFFVLLGSSGSGKTTILNLIAGLAEVDQGQIFLHGREVTTLTPQKRRVGFVFQNYALFQHLSVAENVEFGLAVRKVSRSEREERCEELLELVGLAGLGKRLPRQLSGGEQQRVALARALAAQPEVLLLDEPLGALDARIRTDLRRSLHEIQRRLGITTILVTHDQEEAFDLADRIGVMSYGRLVETGTPEALYRSPQTEFVATFLGTANLLVGLAEQGQVMLGATRFPRSEEAAQFLPSNGRVQILFRPEDVILAAEAKDLEYPCLGVGEVEENTFVGAYERLRLRLSAIPGVRPISPRAPFGIPSILVEATRSPEQAARFPLAQGAHAWMGVRRIHNLTHPGLSFLILADKSDRSQAAITLGGQIALRAHARVTLLGLGSADDPALQNRLQEARKQLTSGLASLEVQSSQEPFEKALGRALEAQPYDVLVMGFMPGEDNAMRRAEQALQAGSHHLLLVPPVEREKLPAHALVCVTPGEPGKDDILFTGRLVRHLGAEAVLLSVIASQPGKMKADPGLVNHARVFLESGIQTMSLLGVPARSQVRWGGVRAELLAELNGSEYDLVVLGAPLPKQTGEISLQGILAQMLNDAGHHPILVVRHSSY